MTVPWWTTLAPTAVRARGRRHTVRAWVSGTVACALTAAALGVVLIGPQAPDVTVTAWGTQTRPSVRALAAGCGPLEQVTTPASQVSWVNVPGVLPYETIVPVAGWFYQDAPTAGETKPKPESVLREMWSGGRVAWYSPGAPASVVAALTALADAHPDWRMRVAPWPAARGEQLGGADADGVRVAFATWGATQTCGQVLAGVAEEVWASGTGAPGADGGLPAKFGPAR